MSVLKPTRIPPLQPHPHLIEDVAWLIEQGETSRAALAERFGVLVATLDQYLYRAMREGDARAARAVDRLKRASR